MKIKKFLFKIDYLLIKLKSISFFNFLKILLNLGFQKFYK
jgi:hypothetical protein